MAATYMFAASERHNGNHSMPGILYTSDHNVLIIPLISPLLIHVQTHLTSPSGATATGDVGYLLHSASWKITQYLLNCTWYVYIVFFWEGGGERGCKWNSYTKGLVVLKILKHGHSTSIWHTRVSMEKQLRHQPEYTWEWDPCMLIYMFAHMQYHKSGNLY